MITDSPIPEEGIRSFTAEPPTQTVVPVDSSLPPVPSSLETAITSQTYITLTWRVNLRPGVAPVTEYTVSTKQVNEPTSRYRTPQTLSTPPCVTAGDPSSVPSSTIRLYQSQISNHCSHWNIIFNFHLLAPKNWMALANIIPPFSSDWFVECVYAIQFNK